MQISDQMFAATDWASMHRERMSKAKGMTAAGKVTGETDTEEKGGGMVSFKETFDVVRGSRMTGRVNGTRKAPYSYLADDSGYINYNGVTFFCDYEKNRICLGDVSDMKKCICVGLSGGGSLVVNRQNLGDLAKAIGMFSPEDIKRIMSAIAQDTMCQQKLLELDEEENSIGEAETRVDEAGNDGADKAEYSSMGEMGNKNGADKAEYSSIDEMGNKNGDEPVGNRRRTEEKA